MSDKKPITLSFLDLETTGLDPDRHSITEVAVIKCSFKPGPDWRDTWEELDRYETKVLPSHPYVEPFVAKLNGYNTDEWMASAQRLPPVRVRVYGRLRGTIICGSNPNFDKGFLEKAMEALDWNFPYLRSHHMIDVPSMAAALLVTGQVDKIRQSTVSQVLEVENKEEHRAMADADQCLRLFLKVLDLTEGSFLK